MKLASLIIGLLLVCGTSSADFINPDGPEQNALEQDALKHCDSDQTSMNLCGYHQYKVLDAELNRLYQQLASRLKETPHEARLRESERTWLKYVEADCLYQNGPREESGTIWPLLQNNCLTQHRKQRIDLLNQFLKCTNAICPGQ